MSYDPGNPQQNPGQGWQGGQQQPYPGSGYGQQPGQPGGQPGGWGGGPPSGPGGSMSTDGRGGLGSLFDFSFNTFATPTLIRIIYIIGTVLLGLGYIAFVISAFYANGAVVGILVLVVGAIAVLFYLALLRVSLEFYYAVVRMSEDIHHRR